MEQDLVDWDTYFSEEGVFSLYVYLHLVTLLSYILFIHLNFRQNELQIVQNIVFTDFPSKDNNTLVLSDRNLEDSNFLSNTSFPNAHVKPLSV